MADLTDMMSQRRTERNAWSREELLGNYGNVLALTADGTPAERARALASLSLDEAGLRALTAQADVEIGKAIADDDLASLLAFKSAFDAGRARVEKARGAKTPPPRPSHLALARRAAEADTAELPAKAPPPQVASERTVAGFTLMQYAALRADVIVMPELQRAAVFQRYGLTEEKDACVAAAWNEEFNADRALFQQYLQLFNYFRGLARR